MPATGRVRPGNVPAESTSFVGRRTELAEIKRMLADARLVTLTGMGGIGKTRLALRVAAEVRRAFRDGVWFVDLTQLREPDADALADLVLAVLGVPRPGGPPRRRLIDHLAGRRALLVLDNCEHLLAPSAVLAEALVRGCPEVGVLATSRQPLAIGGERLYLVPPLGHDETATLFVARARAIAPEFAVTGDDAAAMAELCRRLDGLPLAVELAAARVRALAPPQILDRLADRFALLSQGDRGGPARQRTLRASVEWSFDLCGEPERTLWGRLSVFAGTFELDAVEGICADEALPESEVLEALTGLLDKSILVRDDVRENCARYRMLEAIRDYARDKLVAGGLVVLPRRHRDWYLRMVARANAEGISDRSAYWMSRLARERANLRTAMEFCLSEPGEAEAALRLAVTLPGHYWSAWGLLGEGRRWLDRALTLAPAPTALRAKALLINSHLAVWLGEHAEAARLLTEGEELAGRLHAAAELGHAAYTRGVAALYANDLPVAVERLEKAWTLLAGEPDKDLYLYLNVLLGFGVSAALAGDTERAGSCQRELLAIVEPRAGGRHRSLARWVGGLIRWRQGDPREGAAQVVEALRLKPTWGSDDRYTTALCLEVLAWITADRRRHRRAATLLGAADVCWADVGASIGSYLQFAGHHDTCERLARAALGDAAFTAAFRDGQALAPEDLLAFVLDEPRRAGRAEEEAEPTPLTNRERQIADLLTQGLTNKEIASRLVISRRTAESHVDRILGKLGFSRRAQVAAWNASSRNP
ncbi:ATP-binding protein [Actinoplanes subtropicus]|uniref:ATP-binding protein n=1 Tax=Actinoplanes subtropicus TaxID=543632 RepID=UPI0004C2B7C2|nr:LuxR C-terminal-related transcriptional regulator [Actinoplanes subtropicus]